MPVKKGMAPGGQSSRHRGVPSASVPGPGTRWFDDAMHDLGKAHVPRGPECIDSANGARSTRMRAPMARLRRQFGQQCRISKSRNRRDREIHGPPPTARAPKVPHFRALGPRTLAGLPQPASAPGSCTAASAGKVRASRAP